MCISKTLEGSTLEERIQNYGLRIEHYCRLTPYNWFNFYDFWK